MNVTRIKYNRPIIFLISTLVTLFFFTLIYLSKNKKKQTLAFSFYNTVSVIMFADAMYYTYFNSLPSIKMLKQLNQVAAVGDSVKSILSLTNFLFLLDIPLLIIYSKKKKAKIAQKNKRYNKYIRWGFPTAIALTLVVILGFLSSIELFGPVTNQEIYTYHAKDIKKAITGEREIVEGRSVFNQDDLQELRTRATLKGGKHTGIGKDKNLIVIQVESLQTFPIDLFYKGQEVTPNLNKLIQDSGSLYFDNYYQMLGRGNTSDAEFVSNNSLYPSMEDPTYTQYEQNTFYGLPWILRDKDYNSWAFHGYEKEFWNREKAYINQGFERFISEEDYDLVETSGFGITDGEFFKQSMDYLKELDNIDENPFHAFLITLTSHNPYKIPEKYQYLNIKEEHKDTILGNYLQAIHYMDKALGDFIENLKEEELYDDTVIAIYGDHFGIASTQEPVKELMTDFLGKPYDFDEMMRIPLIIHVPDANINETISTLGSQLDFLPTILNIMGAKNEKGIIFGRDLLNLDEENYVAQQTYMQKGSFMKEDTMFVISRDGIFEHSTAIKMSNREPIDVNGCREMYQKAIDEINKSDFILKKDLMKDIIESNGDIDFNILNAYNIPNKDYIADIEINSKEELTKYYDEGFRIFAVDLKGSKDGDMVLGKDQPEMTMDDLEGWMEEYGDTYVVLRTTEEEDDLLMKVKNEYPYLRNRLIPEIRDFEHFFSLSFRGFSNIILDLSENQYTEKEALDFLQMHPHFGVLINEKQVKTDLPKKLKQMGIDTYVESVNSKLKRRSLKKKHIFGIYTQKLIP